MTEDLVSKILISLVVTALAVLLECVIHTKKHLRSKQSFFPIFALIYGLVFLGLAYALRRDLEDLYRTLLHASSGFPEDEEPTTLFTNAGVFAANIAMIAGFCGMKLFLVITRGKRPAKRSAIRAAFYRFDDREGAWVLQEKWINFRRAVLCVLVTATLGAGVAAGLAWGGGMHSGYLQVYVFPAIMLIVLAEFYDFLTGPEGTETGDRFGGEPAGATRVSQYFRLREILEKLFPDQLLAAHTGSEFQENAGATDMLKAMASSTDRIDRIVADHFSHREKGMELDPDYIRATSNLMHRKSVIFSNPFYHDSGLYTLLPIVNTLLSDHRVLVITARASTQKDVAQWLQESIGKYTRVDALWSVGYLSDRKTDYEVGILTFRQLYDLKVLRENQKFFRQVDFVLLLEPSLIVNTGQLGLSLIASEIASEGGTPVYCVCDRRVNGLVDTLSHVLRTEMVEVSATPVPRNIYACMAWDADGDYGRQRLFDKQTQYLGGGVELASIAIKNQIPKVTWFSETKAPVRDIKWIAGQYYATICRGMNIPVQQKALFEKLEFVSNLWSTPPVRERFVIVEDEFCNLFSTMSMYLSRASRQIFINVLSESYLLRDYMRCNRTMFMSNPDTVPSLVPAYARTERNTVMQLILTMAFRPMTEDEIADELRIAGVETDDVFRTLTHLLHRYTDADDRVLTVRNLLRDDDSNENLRTYDTFQISPAAFDAFFASTLKTAYYLIEDERGDRECIDARLFGHIAQALLPGQLVTYDGKYYQAKYISPELGVILRRASDLYDGRKYYRQVRRYTFGPCESDALVRTCRINDIDLTVLRRDFSVETTAYLEMKSNHDLRTAHLLDFSGDPAWEVLQRSYRNKNVLQLELPETTERMRLTFCIVLSEMLRSIFPNGWPYLAVMTPRQEDVEGMLNYMVYGLEGDVNPNLIYIVEDSTLDLGLLEAVERKFPALMELMTDYFDWHAEKLREYESKDPVMGEVVLPQAEQKQLQRERERESLFKRMVKRIRRIFGAKDEEETQEPPKPETPAEEPAPAEETAKPETPAEFTLDNGETEAQKTEPELPPDEPGAQEEYVLEAEEDGESATASEDSQPEEAPAEEAPSAKTKTEAVSDEDEEAFVPEETDEDADIVHVDGTDIFAPTGLDEDLDWLEDQFDQMGIRRMGKTRYQRECFLKFGYEEIDERIQTREVAAYLRAHSWGGGELYKARKRVAYDIALEYDPSNCCDFCNKPLTGVSYERLADGRIRCNDCAATAISSLEEFQELFLKVRDTMEGIFGIQLNVPIDVITTDAVTIGAMTGLVFTPSTQYADRVLGFAQMSGGGFRIVIENGSPRLATIETISHELTHIWQYLNWNQNDIAARYGANNVDIVYEGMAMWTSVQFMYQIGEISQAAFAELNHEKRTDAYGVGFNLYRDKYPLLKEVGVVSLSPFRMKNRPL